MKWVMIGAVAGVVALGAFSYINAYNTGNQMENTIMAQYDKNRNTLSNMTNQVLEAAQVPDMMKEDLKEIVAGAMEGRYGPDGLKSMVVAIQENYPGQLDSSLYTRIQDIIEARRNEFKVAQDDLIDKTRVYKTALGSFWTGTWLRFAGYPTNDWDWKKYEPVVASRVQEVYETGTENNLQLK